MLFAPPTVCIAQKLNFLEKFEIWSKIDFHYFLKNWAKMVTFCPVLKIKPKCDFLSYDTHWRCKTHLNIINFLKIEISWLIEYSVGLEIPMKFGHPLKIWPKNREFYLKLWDLHNILSPSTSTLKVMQKGVKFTICCQILRGGQTSWKFLDP